MTEKVKHRYDWIYKFVVLALLGWLGTFALTAYDAVENRTFDSAEQKINVIESSKEIIDKGEIQLIKSHIQDSDSHMSFKEKMQIMRIEENQAHIEENQVRIGQDLQEIKNLLRQEE